MFYACVGSCEVRFFWSMRARLFNPEPEATVVVGGWICHDRRLRLGVKRDPAETVRGNTDNRQ